MITFAQHSEAGGHAENQDTFVVSNTTPETGLWLCAVTDGQGGQAGAAAASKLACDTFLAAALRLPLAKLLRSACWPGLLRKVDEAVAVAPGAGFTTLVAFALTDSELVGASSGDSALMVVQSGQPGEVLTARQKKNPPVGSGGAEFVPFRSTLARPWTVLALTDGVWKYAGWECLLHCGQTPGKELIPAVRARAALHKTGELQDDFTLVVFQDAGD
jgi:PPM family protein phosphatase